MTRVLVLGGAGFVGYHLARRLGDDGARTITVVDDLSRGRMDDELAALLRRPGVDFVQADLTDAAASVADLHRLRVGLMMEHLGEELQPQVAAAFDRALATLRARGASVRVR